MVQEICLAVQYLMVSSVGGVTRAESAAEKQGHPPVTVLSAAAQPGQLKGGKKSSQRRDGAAEYQQGQLKLQILLMTKEGSSRLIRTLSGIKLRETTEKAAR